MKDKIIYLTGFLVGFFGIALMIDTNELLIIKSKILFIGLILILVGLIIDKFKKDGF